MHLTSLDASVRYCLATINLCLSFRRMIRATVATTVLLVLKKDHKANHRNTKTHSPHMPYNTPSSFSRFAYLFPKESKCSKWRNSNIINNQTLLILFIFFHNCWNLQMCWMYGCAFKKKCIHYWPRYHVHNLSPPGYITDTFLAFDFQISSAPSSSPFKYSYSSRFVKMLNFTAS
jgi:hypothetical protein